MCLWAVFPVLATSLKVSFHDLPLLLSTQGTIYENKAKVPALTPTPSVDCDPNKDTKNSISRRKPDPSLSAIASRHLQPPELVELSTRFSKTHTTDPRPTPGPPRSDPSTATGAQEKPRLALLQRKNRNAWRGSASESPPMGWFIQTLLSALFLLSIVLSIPIAFDVGGRDSGLAYSLALFTYYLIYSAVRAVTASTRAGRAIGTAFRLSQWIVIPALLIWALSQFAVDAGSTNWVERTFERLVAKKSSSWSEWAVNMIETITLGGWDKTLRYSSPVFQLLEGFCTLLVIQASGQITRWLVNSGRSDTWMVSRRTPHIGFQRLSMLTRCTYRSLSWPFREPSSQAPATSCGVSSCSPILATSMPP